MSNLENVAECRRFGSNSEIPVIMLFNGRKIPTGVRLVDKSRQTFFFRIQ